MLTLASPDVEGEQAAWLAPWGMESARLWSLWDMLKERAEGFIELGEAIADAKVIFVMDDNFHEKKELGLRWLNEKGRKEVHSELDRLLSLAKRLDLPTSTKLIGRRLGSGEKYPETMEEFSIFVEVMKDELSTNLFLFVPPHRSKYHQYLLPNSVLASFPSAAAEIAEAGNAYAYGLNSACVFHAMRAAEIGVRCLGEDLGVKFPFDIALAEWHNILDQVDKKNKGEEGLAEGTGQGKGATVSIRGRDAIPIL